MIATLIGMTIVTALALVAVTAVRGDLPLLSRDLASKRAYEAAKSGVEDYASHLYADSLYWTNCTEVPTPNAVNPSGSTSKRRSVPGEASSSYAIELLPSSTQSTYSQCNVENPGPSMLETSGPTAGSFRIRSTGFAGGTSVPIVASFKRPSFLDYVYFTQLETLDPAAYGYANPSTQLTGAYEQCELTYEEGRQNNYIPGTKTSCSTISFISGDAIEGPVHTNDKFSITGNPRFGRKAQDMVEMSAKSPGWYGSGKPGLRRHPCRAGAGPRAAGNQLETGLHRPAPVHLHRSGADLPERHDDDRRQRQILHRSLLRGDPLPTASSTSRTAPARPLTPRTGRPTKNTARDAATPTSREPTPAN